MIQSASDGCNDSSQHPEQRQQQQPTSESEINASEVRVSSLSVKVMFPSLSFSV